jgi:hypothetical protein
VRPLWGGDYTSPLVAMLVTLKFCHADVQGLLLPSLHACVVQASSFTVRLGPLACMALHQLWVAPACFCNPCYCLWNVLSTILFDSC